MNTFELLEQGRALQKVLIQAAETVSHLNYEADGRLSHLARLIAQAVEEAGACFTITN